MKTRKTPTDKRNTYTYHFADGTKCTVTDTGFVRTLHSLDDSEVYNNLKNLGTFIYDNGQKIRVWHSSDVNEAVSEIADDEYDLLGAFGEYDDVLTDKQRKIAEYVLLYGYNYTETAYIMGCTPQNVRKHFEKAMENIGKYRAK